VPYVGISSNYVARQAAHLAERGISIERIPGLSGLTKLQARAVEQVLIESYGLSKNGGSLLNKINSIATRNEIYADAIVAGRKLLQDAGYVLPK
jgi:filamentous hemagglutinin